VRWRGVAAAAQRSALLGGAARRGGLGLGRRYGEGGVAGGPWGPIKGRRGSWASVPLGTRASVTAEISALLARRGRRWGMTGGALLAARVMGHVGGGWQVGPGKRGARGLRPLAGGPRRQRDGGDG